MNKRYRRVNGYEWEAGTMMAQVAEKVRAELRREGFEEGDHGRFTAPASWTGFEEVRHSGRKAKEVIARALKKLPRMLIKPPSAIDRQHIATSSDGRIMGALDRAIDHEVFNHNIDCFLADPKTPYLYLDGLQALRQLMNWDAFNDRHELMKQKGVEIKKAESYYNRIMHLLDCAWDQRVNLAAPASKPEAVAPAKATAPARAAAPATKPAPAVNREATGSTAPASDEGLADTIRAAIDGHQTIAQKLFAVEQAVSA